MIKLVVTDLDGTLLEESTSNINPEIYDVVRELKERGIIFVAASGRQYESMLQLFEPVKQDVLFLAENGSIVMLRDQVMSVTYLDQNLVEEVIRFARSMPGCDFMLSTPGQMYLDTEDEQFQKLMLEGYKVNAKNVEDVFAYTDRAIKVAIYRPDGIDEIMPEIEEKFGSRMSVMVAGKIWADFLSADIDKGKALAEVQRLMRITTEETMAFGDNCNDIALLSRAKESYAVENADPRLKEVAAHIAPPWNENGVIHIIREKLLDSKADSD